MTKNNALIGFSGLVGKNILMNSKGFFGNNLYNSINIKNIYKKSYDLVICAAAKGGRWQANKNPEEDKNHINNLILTLKNIKSKKMILISTIMVYGKESQIDEDFDIKEKDIEPYAKNRFLLEKFCQDNFNCQIIRLPSIFGTGMNNSVIYDLMNNQYRFLNKNNVFQFYDLFDMWKDINKIINIGMPIINLFSIPILLEKIAYDLFNIKLTESNNEIRKFNIYSKYWKYWNSTIENYLYDENYIYNSLKKYINRGYL